MTTQSTTIDPDDVTVERMEELPESVRGTNRELNMIRYGNNRIHLAKHEDQVFGAIRSAVRDDPRRQHGFLGDLQVDESVRDRGLEEKLIEAGEQRLFQEEECTRIDAVMEDGEGWTRYFAERGFWSSRKTVDMGWDLESLCPVDLPSVSGVKIEQTRSPDLDELQEFILDSYQPYWRFWKEYKQDMRWIRVEYGEDEQAPESDEIREEMRRRVRDRLEDFNREQDQVFFVARRDGEIIAACDALDSERGDTFEWGMMAIYDYGVKNLGSALVGRALNWLHDRGHDVARIKTTSGLDDFDPTVYLYTAANNARILGEYVNCAKLATGEEPEGNVPDDTF